MNIQILDHKNYLGPINVIRQRFGFAKNTELATKPIAVIEEKDPKEIAKEIARVWFVAIEAVIKEDRLAATAFRWIASSHHAIDVAEFHTKLGIPTRLAFREAKTRRIELDIVEEAMVKEMLSHTMEYKYGGKDLSDGSRHIWGYFGKEGCKAKDALFYRDYNRFDPDRKISAREEANRDLNDLRNSYRVSMDRLILAGKQYVQTW